MTAPPIHYWCRRRIQIDEDPHRIARLTCCGLSGEGHTAFVEDVTCPHCLKVIAGIVEDMLLDRISHAPVQHHYASPIAFFHCWGSSGFARDRQQSQLEGPCPVAYPNGGRQ